MATAGIDTWSTCWYLRNDEREADRMDAVATARAGRYAMVPDLVADHRVLWDRTNRLVMAEGHPVADSLAPASAEVLVDAQEAIADGLADLGVPVPRKPQPFDRQGSPGAGGVRRMDFACDIERDADVGRAILTGVAALEAPGQLRSTVHRAPDHMIATVTWEGGRGKMARTYDKGRESGSHAPGERVRLEDQRRYERGHRPLADEVEPAYAAAMFNWRFKGIWAATKGLTVTTLGPAIEKVQQAVEDGEMTPAGALKVIGFLVTEQRGVEVGSRSSRYRHRAAARELGLVLADGVTGEIEIDLAAETAEAREVSWG